MKFLLLVLLSIVTINTKLILPQKASPKMRLKSSLWNSIFSKPSNTKISQSTCEELPLVEKINKKQKYNYSGYLKIKQNSTSVLGFTFYGAQSAKSKEDLQNIPIVLFCNGGPGSSSQIGNLEELGPLLLKRVNGKITQVPNKATWSKNYSLLFVDQPVGTGLSFAENDNIPKNMEEASLQFLQGLDQLFKNSCFKQLNISKDIPLFITGESYAGKYIPAIAEAMLITHKKFGFNLKGIAIGDAFTDPIAIASQYGNYAYKMKYITKAQRNEVNKEFKYLEEYHKGGHYQSANGVFNTMVEKIKTYGNIHDIYNVEKKRSYSGLTDEFFKTQEAFDFYKIDKNIGFGSQSDKVYSVLGKDFLQQDCFQRLQSVIDEGLQVLVYNGRNDMIVCEDCTSQWADKLYTQKNKQNILKNTQYQTWKVQRKTAGDIKKQDNLQLLFINKAGHLVPKDQPLYSLQMVNDFVSQTMSQKTISQE